MTTEGDSDPIIEVVEISPAELNIHVRGMSIPPEGPSLSFDSVSPEIQMALLSLLRAIGNRRNRSEGGLLTLEQVAEKLHLPVSVLREKEILHPSGFDPHQGSD